MDNIRNVIKIFFKHTSYIEVLKNATKYNDIANIGVQGVQTR